MKKFAYILLILFLLPNISKAEIVNKINILGNKRISDETIKVYGDLKKIEAQVDVYRK